MQVHNLDGLTISWIDFRRHKDQILTLREKVYKDEQKFGDFVISSPLDIEGIHIGAFHKGRLVSCLSGYIVPPDHPLIREWKLPVPRERIMQFGKRVELKEYRKGRLNEFMSVVMCKSIYETIQPEYMAIGLMGVHQKLSMYYANTYGFKIRKTIETSHGEVRVLTAAIKGNQDLYIKMKKYVDVLSVRFNIFPPSLSEFLHREGRGNLIRINGFAKENLYTGPLSIRDELPRLTSQARLLCIEQKPHIDKINSIRNNGKFLDLGSGPGVYLSWLHNHPKFKDYTFIGLDNSEELLRYAKISTPQIIWKKSSVYDILMESESCDVIHSSFLFIHLRNPDLALKEVRRLLKPQGIFYVVDVNDSTFHGPSPIKRVIKKHNEHYEGNRSILNRLPELAKKHGLRLSRSFATVVDNSGEESAAKLEQNKLHLGRIQMWGMFSFIGQREELTPHFQKAQQYYLDKDCSISIQVQTQVYTLNGR